jgi:hypothetical protein
LFTVTEVELGVVSVLLSEEETEVVLGWPVSAVLDDKAEDEVVGATVELGASYEG